MNEIYFGRTSIWYTDTTPAARAAHLMKRVKCQEHIAKIIIRDEAPKRLEIFPRYAHRGTAEQAKLRDLIARAFRHEFGDDGWQVCVFH